jgi:hypothetical protein
MNWIPFHRFFWDHFSVSVVMNQIKPENMIILYKLNRPQKAQIAICLSSLFSLIQWVGEQGWEDLLPQEKGKNQWRTNTLVYTTHICLFITLLYFNYLQIIWQLRGFFCLMLLWVIFTVCLFHLLWQCKHMFPMPIKPKKLERERERERDSKPNVYMAHHSTLHVNSLRPRPPLQGSNPNFCQEPEGRKITLYLNWALLNHEASKPKELNTIKKCYRWKESSVEIYQKNI